MERSREEESADIMYGSGAPASAFEKNYENSLRPALNHLQDSTGMNSAEVNAHFRPAARFYHDAQIHHRDAQAIHQALVQHILTPADAGTQQEWKTASRRALRERFGDSADDRLRRADAFIDLHPEMRKALVDSGLRHHPSVVVALAERAPHLPTKRR